MERTGSGRTLHHPGVRGALLRLALGQAGALRLQRLLRVLVAAEQAQANCAQCQAPVAAGAEEHLHQVQGQLSCSIFAGLPGTTRQHSPPSRDSTCTRSCWTCSASCGLILQSLNEEMASQFSWTCPCCGSAGALQGTNPCPDACSVQRARSSSWVPVWGRDGTW